MSILNILNNTNYLKFKPTDSSDDRLFVVFGSHGMKDGRWDFHGTFSDLNKNCLFVRAERNDWYIHPLSYLSAVSVEKSIEYFVSLINELAAVHRFSEVVLFGFSMGAYGAVLYSRSKEYRTRLRCIGIGCKAFLNMPKSVSLNYYEPFWSDTRLDNLLNLNFSPFECDYLLCYGEESIADCYSAKLLGEKLNAKLFPVRSAPHNVMNFLRPSIGLSFFIESLITDGFNDAFLYAGYSNKYLDLMDLEFLVNSSDSFQSDSEIKALRAIVIKYPNLGYVWLALAKYALSTGQGDSLKFLKNAFNLIPYNVELNKILYEYFSKKEDFQGALFYASNFAVLSNYSSQAISNLRFVLGKISL